jgi:hypothetical protein
LVSVRNCANELLRNDARFQSAGFCKDRVAEHIDGVRNTTCKPVNERVRLTREFDGVNPTGQPQPVPDVILCFRFRKDTNIETDMSAELQQSHGRRFHDARKIVITGQDDAQHATVVDLGLADPPQLLQYCRTDQVRVIDDDQDRVAGYRAVDDELSGDTPQLPQLAGNIAETELPQECEVELCSVSAGFIEGRVTDVLIKAGDITIQ